MKNQYTDLIVVGDKKLGIFNKRKCTYVLNNDYDCILLSECGTHIVKKYKCFEEIDEETGKKHNRYETIYCAIVDNDGKIKECNNINLLDKFIDNVAIARCVKTNKMHLIDNNADYISDGFDRIDYINCGLYYAYNLIDNKDYDPNVFEKSTRWFVSDLKLINCSGEVLPYTLVLDEIENPIYAKIKEIDSYNSYVEAISKYGCGIAHITFANQTPSSVREVLLAVNAAINFANKNNKSITEVLSLVHILGKSLLFKKLDLDVEYDLIDFDFDNLCLGIEKNHYKKQIFDALIYPIYKFNRILQNK